ncbi:premelanosome protein a [Neosynchiropus ocellatus]
MRTRTMLLLLLVLAFTSATAIRTRSQFTRYKSWNTRMYPVWKDGDPRFRNCWSGGEVTFDLKNDAPTLTGARATFNINLNFPPNQTALANGQVVWARNCTVNGRQYQQGQPVYPDQDTQATGVFPDGTPFRSQRKKPHYVFVWKTWGRYWQVADGPSSSLTIGTDNVPLGSYNMEVVIYHCRGKDKFIPLGYASTNFIITDQVPFTISLAQVNDVNQDDTNFIQNRAIAFNVMVHDPSLYLNNADISFSWDFGDNTGTLITRERMVTHTYLAIGTFKPQVVLMASIPNGCGIPTAVVPVDPSAAPVVVVTAAADPAAPADPAEGGDVIALDVPASDATPEGANTDDAAAVVDADTDAAGIDAAAEDPATAADVAADDTAAADTADAAAADVAAADAAATDAAAADAAAADAAAADVAAADAAAADAAAADAADVAATDATAADATATDAAAADAAAADATAADATATDAAATDAAAADATAADVAAPEDAAAEDAAEDAAPEDAAPEDAVAEDVAVADAAADEVATADVEAADVTETAADNTVVIEAAASVAPAAEGEVTDAAEDEAAAPAAEEPVEPETEAAAEAPADDDVAAPAATEGTVVEETELVAGDEIVETVNEVAATVAPAEPEVEGEAAPTEAAEVALVIAKRQAPELTADCMVYRYGSLSTTIDVVQGIESVEIVQMANVVSLATEMDQNAVDVTISCQGSLPSEVCTVISDADCITPVETVCSVATPSPDCQMVLRQFFNESGVFCLNVSLTNDVSLAVASARVSVSVASGGSPAGTAATVLGMMVLACVVCCVGLMYRRFKQYQPLREDHDGNNGGVSTVTSVPMLLWNLLSRQSPGESRPLLQGRIV